MNDTRYVLGLSGGRDSAALAVHMRDRYPELDIDYFFSDTGSELPEVYKFLTRLEGFLGKDIERLDSGRDFNYWLRYFRYYLPSPQSRWCTREMKLKPFFKWIATDVKAGRTIVNLVAIRSDEADREGLRSSSDNIEVRFPFLDDGIDKDDVIEILNNAGLGLPEYYSWRSRSGCSFCFYQSKMEWVGLLENHPKEFENAVKLERLSREKGGRAYTWMPSGPLEEIIEKKEEIKAAHAKKVIMMKKRKKLQNPLRPDVDLDLDDINGQGKSCLMCHK